MACPVWGRTMQSIGRDDPKARTWWCGGCGTLKEYTGDFSRVEMPGDLRHVVDAARLDPAKQNSSQHATVKADFSVKQYDTDHPRVELVIYDHLGRRMF